MCSVFVIFIVKWSIKIYSALIWRIKQSKKKVKVTIFAIIAYRGAWTRYNVTVQFVSYKVLLFFITQNKTLVSSNKQILYETICSLNETFLFKTDFKQNFKSWILFHFIFSVNPMVLDLSMRVDKVR